MIGKITTAERRKKERKKERSVRGEEREPASQGFESSRGSALATQRRVKWIGDDTSAATTQSRAVQGLFPFGAPPTHP